MKTVSRLLSYLSAGLGILTLIRARSGMGKAVLFILKLFAGALSPFLALAGVLGALGGAARRDRKAFWAGLLGAGVAARHIVHVTAPHRAFERAFGADWRARIPPELRRRMLHKRWTPVRVDPPRVSWQRDVVCGTHVETGDSLLADLWQPPPDLRTLYDAFGALPAMTGTWPERQFKAALERGFGFEFVPVGEWIPNFLGGTPDAVPELYRLGSPITHVGPHCPPTLLLQGDNNLSSIPSDVRRLHRELRRANVTAVHVEFPNTQHGFDTILPKWSPSAQAAIYDVERFLALMI